MKVSGHMDVDTVDVDDHATVGGRLTYRSGATITGDKLSSSSSSSSSSSLSPVLLKVEENTLIQNDLQVDGTLTSAAQAFDGDIIVTGNAKVYSLTANRPRKLMELLPLVLLNQTPELLTDN
mmetsp:Transcript_58840/g.65903  ORF Transcript_58840/g.65903 Transcript_58840/m.65903 type:complete len:122 (-) Transcript_58840:493-858(-)